MQLLRFDCAELATPRCARRPADRLRPKTRDPASGPRSQRETRSPSVGGVSWSEANGQATRAFDEWKATDAEIRAFIGLSHKWVEAAYQATWEEAEREFGDRFDPDRDDPEGHVDVFHQKVAGLWAKDYFWMLRSGALRDAVTAFEVYAEKSLSELLGWYQFGGPDGANYHLAPVINEHHLSPSWPTLRRIHTALGNDIEPEPVKYVRSLRHLLTHQRGELRTDDQRQQYSAEGSEHDWLIGDAYVGGDVPLGQERVLELMGQLGDVVRASDPVVWNHTWGQSGFPDALRVLAMEKDSPLRIL
jgi:hypothetical protein